jgi:hypothetical protein
MLKNKKNLIRKSLERQFQKTDKAKFYFVKGLKEHRNTIIVKSKKILSDDEINRTKGVLQKDLNDPLLELLQWAQSLSNLIPKKNIYKEPFFDSEDIKEFNSWRVCPVGEHWVSRHLRQRENLEDVDGHCRKNRSGKNLIKADEIKKISQSKKFKEVTTKANEAIIKNSEFSNTYNEIINGWVAFWNDQFHVEPPLHPNHVKALIASESTFNPTAINTKNSPKKGPARGLMQITEETQRYLAGDKNELKDHLVILSDDEIWDPSCNINAGVRWLFRKREITKSKLKRNPTWEEVLWDYKGALKSKKPEDVVARKLVSKHLADLEKGAK